MMNFKNEEAVSPVIGVILMVAITVILAAVIAAFVFGMSGNVQGTKVVSIGSKLVAEDNIELMINGGADLPGLTGLKITFDGEPVVPTDPDPLPDSFEVGQIITIANEGGRLLVVGTWGDGAEQILLDKTYAAKAADDE